MSSGADSVLYFPVECWRKVCAFSCRELQFHKDLVSLYQNFMKLPSYFYIFPYLRKKKIDFACSRYITFQPLAPYIMLMQNTSSPRPSPSKIMMNVKLFKHYITCVLYSWIFRAFWEAAIWAPLSTKQRKTSSHRCW